MIIAPKFADHKKNTMTVGQLRELLKDCPNDAVLCEGGGGCSYIWGFLPKITRHTAPDGTAMVVITHGDERIAEWARDSRGNIMEPRQVNDLVEDHLVGLQEDVPFDGIMPYKAIYDYLIPPPTRPKPNFWKRIWAFLRFRTKYRRSMELETLELPRVFCGKLPTKSSKVNKL